MDHANECCAEDAQRARVMDRRVHDGKPREGAPALHRLRRAGSCFFAEENVRHGFLFHSTHASSPLPYVIPPLCPPPRRAPFFSRRPFFFCPSSSSLSPPLFLHHSGSRCMLLPNPVVSLCFLTDTSDASNRSTPIYHRSTKKRRFGRETS